MTKLENNGPVTFVTPRRFTVLFFLPLLLKLKNASFVGFQVAPPAEAQPIDPALEGKHLKPQSSRV